MYIYKYTIIYSELNNITQEQNLERDSPVKCPSVSRKGDEAKRKDATINA